MKFAYPTVVIPNKLSWAPEGNNYRKAKH